MQQEDFFLAHANSDLFSYENESRHTQEAPLSAFTNIKTLISCASSFTYVVGKKNKKRGRAEPAKNIRVSRDIDRAERFQKLILGS